MIYYLIIYHNTLGDQTMEFLYSGLLSINWQMLVMYAVGGLLIWLAIAKDFEPALLLPMGFGAILVNLPDSGVLNQMVENERPRRFLSFCLLVSVQ